MPSPRKKSSKPKTTAKAKAERPERPYAGFPLSPHLCGYWSKKIRGRVYYFGSWRDDPEGTAALAQFNREWPYLKEGKEPPAIDVPETGITLRNLVNQFLAAKEQLVDSGELSPRSWRDYYLTCDRLVDFFGKDKVVKALAPDDFRKLRAKLAERFGPVSRKNEITRVKSVFKFAFENGLIETPVKYGTGFDPPSAKSLRINRAEGGPKVFTREEILRLLDAASCTLKAMILLGINCGFGNSDCARLPQTAVDWENGWINFPRPKTGIERRIPLWPETLAVLREALTLRPENADAESRGLCFLTRQGRPWVRTKPKAKGENDEAAKPATPIDALSPEFKKLLRQLGINGRRSLGFYTLRHNFETIAGESADQVAVDAIMGHVDPSMAARYRHGVSDARLRAVVETVRAWLYSPIPEGEEGKEVVQ